MANEPIPVRRVEHAGHSDASAEYAPPEPRSAAIRLLAESREMMQRALETLRTENDPATSAQLVGRASDRIGHSLHFLRQVLRT